MSSTLDLLCKEDFSIGQRETECFIILQISKTSKFRHQLKRSHVLQLIVNFS